MNVAIFRQNLRRSLLNSSRFVRDGFNAHGLLFFAPTTLAVFLAIMLVMFVINPKIPFNFHNSMSSGRGSSDLRQAESQPDEAGNTAFNGNLVNWVEQMQQSTEADLDMAFVRYLAQERQQFDPGAISPVGKTRLLAVTQYQLDNGQRVLVYTQLPDEQIRYFRAY